MFYFKFLYTTTFCILLITTYASASTYLPVNDEAYDTLNRLEAEGVIKSCLITTKPLSRNEVIRLILEAERNSEGKGEFIENLIKSLKKRFKDETRDVKFIKPIDNLYMKYVYTDSDIQALNYNNNGDLYEKGSNVRVGLSSRTEFGWLSFYINPEYRYSDDKDLLMQMGYGVLSLFGLELNIGKDSQWWGPGYHGAILLSNNAEPLTMLRLTNPEPVLLPWIFKYLGTFKFTLFTTRLEKQRPDVPEPYLWGMRLNFKPHPYLEIGLGRTAILGGKGRSESLETWWNSFTGKGENEPGSDAGDQRAGGDLKITLPFKLQPLQLYLEASGEDEAGGLPYKWAYLTGIYLPRILSLERIDFRGEYSTTYVKGSPSVWYNHGIYTAGYTYKDRIMGHHMGTDSKDIFIELSYLVPERDGRISISYDIEGHNLSGAVREKKDELSLTLSLRLKNGLRIKASHSYGRLKNLNNILGEDKEINQAMGLIYYTF